jgi:hypothetical protein
MSSYKEQWFREFERRGGTPRAAEEARQVIRERGGILDRVDRERKREKEEGQ